MTDADRIEDLEAQVAELEIRSIPVAAFVQGAEVVIPGPYLKDLIETKRLGQLVCEAMRVYTEAPDDDDDAETGALGIAIRNLAEEFNAQFARAGVMIGPVITSGETH